MLCQNYQKRIASVHFTQDINGNKVEMYLCDHCAKEKGKISFGYPFNINDFFSGLMGYEGTPHYVAPIQREEVCEQCGMSYDDFSKIGKLGCSHCYTAYGERLEPLLRRIHGNPLHTGKIPARTAQTVKASKEIEALKEHLSKAIQSEEYEKAAELRDRIKAFEAEKQEG